MRSERLIFIHGFMGDKSDWAPLVHHLPGYKSICVDGDELNISEPSVLIGYSMGGRIAMSFADKHPELVKHLILLSAHPPLEVEKERESRWEHDLKWIEMLEKEPFDHFLEKWYAQPIFSTLKHNRTLFDMILAKRRKQDPNHLIEVMKRWSLGKQPPLRSFFPSSLYLYGEEDLKFAAVSCKLPRFVKTVKIPHASHMIHLENPAACAKQIEVFLI